MAPEHATTSALKRKAPHHEHAVRSHASKRQKTQAIRAIPSQSTDAALSQTGELNVAMFVKAREYEIKSLEKSMQNSRHALATRAFQQVPRNMRRRTASHNVKKVPRRLRRRAEREMKEDNTPTVTSRRRTPSTKMRLRLETAKRIRTVNSASKTATARKKAKKQNVTETDPEAHVPTTPVPNIKKNQLAKPPAATSKFKKRQMHKTWLPTHLWHAKRAQMTKSSEPLWRMAIPLTPTEKCFRPSHRASGGRGAVAWDMSYMATIACEGVYGSLVAMLKAIGVREENGSGSKGKRWVNGSRSLSSWTHEAGNTTKIIGPITVLWASDQAGLIKGTTASNAASNSTNGRPPGEEIHTTTSSAPAHRDQLARRKILIRVHPSVFHQLWTELSTIARKQRPMVAIEDLRFEIASIDIIGPSSTEALCAILQPTKSHELPTSSSAQIWTKLSGLTNPASLPAGAMLGFQVGDPRLDPPKSPISGPATQVSIDELTDLVADWPSDESLSISSIVSQEARALASRALPSQKAINRRRSQAPPFEVPTPQDHDPQIPVMLLASRPSTSTGGAQGAWTVLLPWKCLDLIWRCLMYYPLSTGGNPRFGGLDETRQIALEQNRPWFPCDFPGTDAGSAWERTEMEKRYNSWSSRPPSRRVNYDSLKLGDVAKGEHGRGWACDWEVMLASAQSNAHVSSGSDVSSNIKPHLDDIQETELSAGRINDAGQASKDKELPARPAPRSLLQLAPNKAVSILRSSAIMAKSSLLNQPVLATIRLTLLTRGSPFACARIYRLPPSTDCKGGPNNPPSRRSTPSHRRQWLEQDPHGLYNRNVRMKKIKTNHRDTTATHSAYDDEFSDLEAIDYRPPGMVPEATAEVQKKREELRAKRAKFQAQKQARQGNGEGSWDGKSIPKSSETRTQQAKENDDDDDDDDFCAREELLRDLMRPCAERNAGEENMPPCPAISDLIGFVTTGGYNLGLGRGTAIGAVWVQRLLEGWQQQQQQEEEEEKGRQGQEARRLGDGQAGASAGGGGGGGGRGWGSVRMGGSGRDGQVKEKENKNKNKKMVGKQMQRERRLCIVRNAGESVGRLAFWEVCE